MSEPRDGPVGATGQGQGQDKAPAVLSFVRFQQAAPRSPTPDAVCHWPCYPVHVKGLVRATVGPSREKVLPSPVCLDSLNCGPVPWRSGCARRPAACQTHGNRIGLRVSLEAKI